MDAEPKQLQQAMQRAAPAGVMLSFRPMFGGIMGYADGRPVASLSNVGLALKLAGADRVEMLALPGAAPLRYEPDAPPSKSYVVLPGALLADAHGLRGWIARAAAGLPPRAGKKGRVRA